MNTQSLSPALSLSKSFLMNFGYTDQPHQNEKIKDNNQNIPPKQLLNDSYQPSKPVATASKTATLKPSMSFSRSESVNLQIRTKEGDVVTINFKRSETRGDHAVNKGHKENSLNGGKQNHSFNSDSKLKIESGSNKAKQQSSANVSKNAETEASRQNTQPKKNPVTSKQQRASEVKNVATPTNTAQPAKPDTNQSIDLENTTGSKKLVASRRSDFQIEQGNKKLSASKEEKYTIESTNNSSSNKTNKQSISQNRIENTPPKPSQQPAADKKPVRATAESQSNQVTTKQPEKLQNTTIEGNKVPTNTKGLVPNSGNTVQMEQSINGVNADGGSYSFSSDFSLNIEGDLYESELQSITDLMKAMSQVSHGFFQGGGSNAFSHAQQMGFETEQIAGFSMDANKQKSVQAVAAYQQTALPDQKINTDKLVEASGFLSQAKESIANTKIAVEPLAEPKKSFFDMFAGVGQMFFDVQDTSEEKNSGDMFLKMIEHISADLFNN